MRSLALVPALVAFVALGIAIVLRIPAPFALEWQEPAMLEHSLRLAAGDALYVEPSIEFAPFPYPPLFPLLGALVAQVVGPSLLALRLVSLLGVGLLLGALLRSSSGLSGVIAAGWFASLYVWTGSWLDVGRVDTLALGLGATAFALVLGLESRAPSRGEGWGWAGAAGLASALAVLTKQTQLGLAVALALALFLRAGTRRAGVAYLVVLLGVLVPVAVWLDHASEGWFLWTTVDLLRGSPFHGPAVGGFWAESWLVLGLPVALGILARVAATSGTTPGSTPGLTPEPTLGGGWSPALVLGAGALVLTGWIGRAHEGGFDNTLMPAALASAFLVGGALGRLSRRPAPFAVGAALIGAAVATQVPGMASALPGSADRAAYLAACAKVDALREGGPVWQPISALPSEVPGYVHRMAIVDLAKSQETAVAADLLGELREALTEKRFAAIILAMRPREGWGDLAPLIDAHYEVTDTLVPPGPEMGGRRPLTPATGAQLAPHFVLTPRR